MLMSCSHCFRVRDPGEGGERRPSQAARVRAPLPQLLGGGPAARTTVRGKRHRQEPIRGERPLRHHQDRHRPER